MSLYYVYSCALLKEDHLRSELSLTAMEDIVYHMLLFPPSLFQPHLFSPRTHLFLPSWPLSPFFHHSSLLTSLPSCSSSILLSSSPFLLPHLFCPHLSFLLSFLLSFPPSLLSSAHRAQRLLWISLRQLFQSTSHQLHSLLLTTAVHGPTSSYTGERVSLITTVTLSSFMHMQK